MKPTNEDLEQLLYKLVTITDGIQRSRRFVMDPTRLAILQMAGTQQEVRPSEIAAALGVHQSSIARQTRVLEKAGHITVKADPTDRRSCLISLTEEGWGQVKSTIQNGIDAFAEFLDDWESEEVRTLTGLLTRLEESVGATLQRKYGTREPGRTGRRWQQNQGEK